MPAPLPDALFVELDARLSLADVALRSGLTELEVLELVECGALAPSGESAGQRVFGWRSVRMARTARRLRDEFELEAHGVAVLLRFAERVSELEEEVRALRARVRG